MSNQLLLTDTNVFLHCTFFTDIDWRTLVSGQDVVLTICPAVLSELEKKKFGDPSRRVRDRARGVVRKVGELVEDDQPVQFRQGCWLWVTCRSPLIDLESIGLSKDVVDDVIIASAVEERDRGRNVAIVSTDTGMRLKGNTHRLRTLRVPEEWMLPDEMDEHERELRALRKQVVELAAASPNLKLTFGGHTVAEYVLKRTKPLTPEAIKKKLEGMRKVRKYQPLSVPVYGDGIIVPGVPSRARVLEYNDALEAFFTNYEDFLTQSHEIFEARDRSMRFDIVVENSGQESAEDVDVILTASNVDGAWFDQLPEGNERPPKPPEPPRESLLSTMPPTIPNIRSAFAPRDNAVTVDIDYTKPTEARFHVNRVKPRFPVPLPSRYFVFESFDAAGSFTLAYQLFGRNLRIPQPGELHIKVQREDENPESGRD